MKNFTLRAKLYLMILIVLIPLFVLQICNIVDYQQHAIQAELTAQLEYSAAVRATFVNYLDYLWDFGLSVGSTIVTNGDDSSPEKVGSFLEELVSANQAFEDFSWIDSEGTVYASTVEDAQGVSVTDLDVIQQIFEGADQGISDIVIGKVTNQMVIPVAQAIRRQGRLVGIFVASLRPEQLGELFPRRRGNQIKNFGFIDGQGMVISSCFNEDQNWQSLLLPKDSLVFAALNGQVVQFEREPWLLDGSNYLGVVIPIPELNWAVFTSSSRHDLLATARDRARKELNSFLLVAVISFMAAMALGDHFVRPIRTIQRSTLAISKGDYSARTQMVGDNELAITGQIFDQMADRIQVLEDSSLQFLQTAAHELRNPMSGIKGILSLLQRQVAQGQSIVSSQRILTVMEKEIDRLSRLLNQILEAFRTQRETQYLALQLKKIDLAQVLEGAIQYFGINEKSVQIRFETSTRKGAWIRGDFIRLEEVLRNLIHNAIKFSPPQSQVLVRLKADGADWLIAIQDQGIGIPKEQLEYIFDCFQRASNINESDDPGGVGLGLYICKAIIEGHQGRIWVTSEEGYGSNFYIRIPGF